MSRYIFLFNLDSTITKQEILPTVARKVGIYDEFEKLNESALHGEVPFKKSFLDKVEIFKKIPVSTVNDIVRDIELNEKLLGFIRANKDRCYVVTGNLDAWIEGLLSRMGIGGNVFCSKAFVRDGYIEEVFSVTDKYAVTSQMVVPFVAVGDGNSDAQMIEAAKVGIGYGGAKKIAPAVLESATHLIYNEDRLVYFLEKLL